MAKDKQVKKPEAPKFVPPEAYVGQGVYWHHGNSAAEGSNPILAIVTEVCGSGRVRLAILSVDSATFTAPDDPVVHKNDPAATRIVESDPDAGIWEENPNTLTSAEVQDIRALLADFTSNKPSAPSAATFE